MRLLGVGVSKLSPAAGQGSQVDGTLDEITARFGTRKLTRGLAMDAGKKDDPERA